MLERVLLVKTAIKHIFKMCGIFISLLETSLEGTMIKSAREECSGGSKQLVECALMR